MIRLSFDGRLLRDDILQKARKVSASHNITLDTSQNYLFMAENFSALSLLLKYYAGKIDLVYADPPFNTQHDFYISDTRANSVSAVKSRRAYTDRMTPEKFLAFIRTGRAWRNIPVPDGRHWRTDPANFDLREAGHSFFARAKRDASLSALMTQKRP